MAQARGGDEMLRHPYYLSPAAEQRREAIELYKAEAIRFLAGQSKPVAGRILEAVNIKH